ncbi:MAG TPA: hypothetical protein VGL11_11105 [Candidatus Binatia bacterium]
MMNAGFLLSANALATVCLHPGIPVLMLIGHSGGGGEENAGRATVGALTEPVLQAMHIVYEKVGRFEDIRTAIRDSQMREKREPQNPQRNTVARQRPAREVTGLFFAPIFHGDKGVSLEPSGPAAP